MVTIYTKPAYTLLYTSLPLESPQLVQKQSRTVELAAWQAKHMLSTIDPLGNWLAVAVQQDQSSHLYQIA
jgi:hypothetical protein